MLITDTPYSSWRDRLVRNTSLGEISLGLDYEIGLTITPDSAVVSLTRANTSAQIHCPLPNFPVESFSCRCEWPVSMSSLWLSWLRFINKRWLTPFSLKSTLGICQLLPIFFFAFVGVKGNIDMESSLRGHSSFNHNRWYVLSSMLHYFIVFGYLWSQSALRNITSSDWCDIWDMKCWKCRSQGLGQMLFILQQQEPIAAVTAVAFLRWVGDGTVFDQICSWLHLLCFGAIHPRLHVFGLTFQFRTIFVLHMKLQMFIPAGTTRLYVTDGDAENGNIECPISTPLPPLQSTAVKMQMLRKSIKVRLLFVEHGSVNVFLVYAREENRESCQQHVTFHAIRTRVYKNAVCLSKSCNRCSFLRIYWFQRYCLQVIAYAFSSTIP